MAIQAVRSWIQDAYANENKFYLETAPIALVAGTALSKYMFVGLNPIVGGTLAAIYFLAVPLIKKSVEKYFAGEKSLLVAASIGRVISAVAVGVVLAKLLPLSQAISFFAVSYFTTPFVWSLYTIATKAELNRAPQ